MTESSLPSVKEKRFNPTTNPLFVMPLVALAGVILLFLQTGGGLNLSSPAPVEALSIERTVLKPGKIEVYVRNSSPDDLTIAQAVVNDAVWPFTISPGATIPRLQKAWISIQLSLVLRRNVLYPLIHLQCHSIRPRDPGRF